MRKFHIQKINEYHEKQKEKIEEAKGKLSPPKKTVGPNIPPTSTYNFK